MIDNRFSAPGTDTRFATLGLDARFPSPGVDTRFATLGVDGRFSASGTVSPLAIYAVLGFTPELVLDFDDEKYFANSASTTFSNAITHSASSNATMVDSDGLLKWRPHNLLSYSEQFDNAVWFGLPASSTQANVETDPNGNLTADRYTFSAGSWYKQQNHIQVAGNVYTFSVWLKSVSGNQTVRLYADNTIAGPNITINETWQRFSLTFTASSTTSIRGSGITRDTLESAADFYIWGAHLYRSDLGGMVNNPDRGDSYVPTTSSAVYLPRRGHHVYNGTSWVNEGLLHESEARTNLITHSAEFDNAYWVPNNILPFGSGSMADAEIAPSGESTADKIVENTSNSTHGVYSAGYTVTSGVTYTKSVYVKAAGRSVVRMQFETRFGSSPVAYFDLTTQEVTADADISSASITPEENGWFRCSITSTATSTGNDRFYVYTAPAVAGLVYTGDGTSGIYIWGAQLEAASTPSSYIPTSGSTVSRAADTLTIPSAKLPWPTPNVIGPELVTNGAFDSNAADWIIGNAGTTITVSSGVATVSNSTVNYGYVYQSLTTVAGRTYTVSGATSAGGIEVRNSTVSGTILASTGESAVFTALSSTSILKLGLGLAPDSRTFDNISVREIDPLAVSIQMEGRMTYADEGISIPNSFVRWRSSVGTNLIRLGLDTSTTRTGQAVFQQYYNGVADSPTNAPLDSYPPGVNVPFNLASRHGSTFINGAVDGTALTADTTPTGLSDLSSTDLSLGYDYLGTIRQLRIWADDLGDTGIADASITAPLIFGEPTISGNTNQGATLTAASAPVVIGTPSPSTTWQWSRDGSPISGATSGTYTLVEADVGSTITVTQTETNAGGSDSATSAATDTIVAVPAGAIQQRDSAYILDRAGNYIEVRA